MRQPIVAGQFYEAGFNELDKQINEAFLHKKGPGTLPIRRQKKELAGVIVPHAGYMFSAPCAAWAYKEIAESSFPDLFLLLGPNHSGLGETSTLSDDWKTPFGIVEPDRDFIKLLVENTSIKSDILPHRHEHSIEVQLPFLQFASRDNLQKLRIAPVCVSYGSDYSKLARELSTVISLSKKKVCIIVSSDFTHFGVSYGYMPFSDNIQENMYKLDKEAIEFINRTDAQGFMNYCEKKQATICGKYPIAILLELLKNKKASLLQYYTSADIAGDYNNAVGYAAISFH